MLRDLLLAMAGVCILAAGFTASLSAGLLSVAFVIVAGIYLLSDG